LAGKLASKWAILPWKTDTAFSAVTKVFDLWLTNQPQGTTTRESAQILECIANFIDGHGDSRFSDIEGGTRGYITKSGNIVEEPEITVRDRAGYFKNINGVRIYLFTSGGLREATKGHDFPRVLQTLTEVEAFTEIDSNDNRKAKKVRLPDGGSGRLYHIDPAKVRDTLAPVSRPQENDSTNK
jgi:putative DNA primase/helicase